MLTATLAFGSLCAARAIYRSWSNSKQEQVIDTDPLDIHDLSSKKMKEVISTHCLESYQNSPTSVPHLGTYEHSSNCLIEVKGVVQHAASLHYYKQHNLVIVACKGSSTLNDWLSNFSEYTSTDNEDMVPKFVNDCARIMLKRFESFVSTHSLKKLTVITCGHSRGGAIASYLGYLIKSSEKFRNFNVKVVTYACMAYATQPFATKFCQTLGSENVLNKISLYDPIRLLRNVKCIPGPTKFIELESFWCSNAVVAPFALAAIEFIESLYELLGRLKDLSIAMGGSYTAGSLGFVEPISINEAVLKGLVLNFLASVLSKLCKGDGHSMHYYNINEHGPINEVVKAITQLLDNCNNTVEAVGNVVFQLISLVLNWIKTKVYDRHSTFITRVLEFLKQLFQSKIHQQ